MPTKTLRLGIASNLHITANKRTYSRGNEGESEKNKIWFNGKMILRYGNHRFLPVFPFIELKFIFIFSFYFQFWFPPTLPPCHCYCFTSHQQPQQQLPLQYTHAHIICSHFQFPQITGCHNEFRQNNLIELFVFSWTLHAVKRRGRRTFLIWSWSWPGWWHTDGTEGWLCNAPKGIGVTLLQMRNT